ncbi:hypothetical protein AVEN_201257-1, partial [Araneus ventricosus]
MSVFLTVTTREPPPPFPGIRDGLNGSRHDTNTGTEGGVLRDSLTTAQPLHR